MMPFPVPVPYQRLLRFIGIRPAVLSFITLEYISGSLPNYKFYPVHSIAGTVG